MDHRSPALTFVSEYTCALRAPVVWQKNASLWRHLKEKRHNPLEPIVPPVEHFTNEALAKQQEHYRTWEMFWKIIEWIGLLHGDFQIPRLIWSMAFASSKIDVLDFLHFVSTTPHSHDFEWPSVGAHKFTHRILSYVSDRHTLKLTKTNIVMISLFKNGRYRLTLHILTQRIITATSVGPKFSLQKRLSSLRIFMKPCRNMFFARVF